MIRFLDRYWGEMVCQRAQWKNPSTEKSLFDQGKTRKRRWDQCQSKKTTIGITGNFNLLVQSGLCWSKEIKCK